MNAKNYKTKDNKPPTPYASSLQKIYFSPDERIFHPMQ